jgi:hypothetical protein
MGDKQKRPYAFANYRYKGIVAYSYMSVKHEGDITLDYADPNFFALVRVALDYADR